MKQYNLLDVCEVYQPKTIATKDFVDGGKYFVYGANGAIGLYDKYNHENSEVLMACRGASCGVINISKPYSWINGNAMVIHPKGTVPITQKYLAYCLKALDKRKIISGTAQPQITRNNMKGFCIPVCDVAEQEKIVFKIEELFSSLDNAVEMLNRIKEQLAVYRQSVLKELFGKLNGDKTVLEEVIVSKPRNGYSPKGVTYVTPYKNLTLTATTKGFFQEDCFKYIDIDIDDDSYLWVKHNDILIQRANTVEYVGISAIYKGDDNKYVYPDLMMKFHIKDGINPSFILYQLKYSHAIGYYRKHATGTAGSMPKINQTTVMNTPIIMTSIDNQIRIVKELDSKYSLCDSIEEMVDKALVEAEALRQSILKEAFEGRLV